jgi:hypothetical protein
MVTVTTLTPSQVDLHNTGFTCAGGSAELQVLALLGSPVAEGGGGRAAQACTTVLTWLSFRLFGWMRLWALLTLLSESLLFGNSSGMRKKDAKSMEDMEV